MADPFRNTRVVLERGSWWEVDKLTPGEVEFYRKHADAYIRSESTHPDARERVRKVWIENQYAPAWHAHSEIRGKPPRRTQLAPQAAPAATPDDDTLF